jgi:hypothetical protein
MDHAIVFCSRVKIGQNLCYCMIMDCIYFLFLFNRQIRHTTSKSTLKQSEERKISLLLSFTDKSWYGDLRKGRSLSCSPLLICLGVEIWGKEDLSLALLYWYVLVWRSEERQISLLLSFTDMSWHGDLRKGRSLSCSPLLICLGVEIWGNPIKGHM